MHFGHVGVAKRALAELSLDRLIVVPAAVSPFKTGKSEAWTERLWNRLELVRAAFGGIGKVVVDERELRRGGVSYAIDTVREIGNENPGAELFFIIGEDSVSGLPKWKDYEELGRLCTFRAYPRTPESSTEIRRLFADNGVVLNADDGVVKAVREGIVRKNGYCPCRISKSREFFCPCEEFRRQLADGDFHGLCHCRLYLKP